MNPIAVLFAPGFEEAEALTIVDIPPQGKSACRDRGGDRP